MARRMLKKKGKKKWYPILASKSFDERLLGESYVPDPEMLKDKFVSINLSTITNNYRDQNVNLTFKVNSIIEGKARTKIVKYLISSSFLKRFVRRGRSKVTDSFIAKDKKGNRIRVKPLVVTYNKAANSQQTKIRKLCKAFAKKKLKKMAFDHFVTTLIRNQFQRKLRDILKKVTPIKYAEIRSTYFEKETFSNEEETEKKKEKKSSEDKDKKKDSKKDSKDKKTDKKEEKSKKDSKDKKSSKKKKEGKKAKTDSKKKDSKKEDKKKEKKSSKDKDKKKDSKDKKSSKKKSKK